MKAKRAVGPKPKATSKRASTTRAVAQPKVVPLGPLPGVSARNPELEAVIEADPTAVEPYLVYGEWLRAQRDARGELIRIEAAHADNHYKEYRDEETREVLAKFKQELLGPLAANATHRDWGESARRPNFEWWYAWVTTSAGLLV